MGGDSVVEYHETKSESEDSRGNCIQMLGTDQGNKRFVVSFNGNVFSQDV